MYLFKNQELELIKYRWCVSIVLKFCNNSYYSFLENINLFDRYIRPHTTLPQYTDRDKQVKNKVWKECFERGK